jgi:hypothetical protein
MIEFHSGTLVFRTSGGEKIPCLAEEVTVELVGGTASVLDPHLVRQASSAVLHYFKVELGRTEVTVGEFVEALTTVLRGFGLQVADPEPDSDSEPLRETDLRHLARRAGKGFELIFFAELQSTLRKRLAQTPGEIRFRGLRGCVKELTGAQRWGRRCDDLSDQIVDYLRRALTSLSPGGQWALWIR